MHAHHVHPSTSVCFGGFGGVVLKTTVEEEFKHQIIILDAFEQGFPLDFTAMIGIYFRVFRSFLLKVLKNGFSLEHGLDDIRIWEGKVDDVVARIERTCISFGPFVDVAPSTDSADIDAWHEPGVTSFGNDITEGEFLHLRVVLHLAHDHGEGADVGWPKDVAARGGLAAPVEGAPMDGSHLVGVVALVGARTCIVE